MDQQYSMNRISVVIPSKTASNFVPCMTNVRKYQPDARVILVDDGVSPELVSLWQFGGGPDLIVAGIKPFIFSRAMNMGIQVAGDDDVVLCNDDALLKTKDGFAIMQHAATRDDIGIVGAVTNVTGQPLQQPKNIGLREVPHIAFVCVLIPRKTINRVGLLDERYCIDYGVEDLDYCYATRKAGLKVTVHDGCFVDHASLKSTFRGEPHTPKSYDKNLALFHKKWGIGKLAQAV